MNGATPPQPSRRRYTPNVAGRGKSSSRLGLKQPDVAKAESFKQTDDFSNILRICLLFTLGVDCLGALALAGGQFLMAPTFFGTLAAATLLAIGIANGWAFNSVRRAASTWARDAFIAQVSVLFLAGYVILTDARSPRINWYLMATAVLFFAAAFLWFVFLVPRSRLEWTKAAVIVTALFPLVGLLQFWLQNYYIPSTSMPLVDISTELSPQGWTGPIIHLSAKVTIHNRGAMTVNVANSLMRVTAYPFTIPGDTQLPANPCAFTADKNQDWCLRADALDPSGGNSDVDYPLLRTPPASNRLLYAGAYSSPTSFLVAGQTDTFQREVDIDSRNVRLARLTFSAIFLTQRRIEDIRSCKGKHASLDEEVAEFSTEVDQVQAMGATGRVHYFCREYDIAPANIIDRLINSHPSMQVYTFLDNPLNFGYEFPQISSDFGTAGQFDRPDPGGRLERRLEQLYPVENSISQSEYASTDKPPPPPPSPAPTPPSGNG
jgi:hypothetical protein